MDSFLTLMGMEFLFRLYVVETGGPAENYKKVECDIGSYMNDFSTTGHGLRHVVMTKRPGDGGSNADVQTIDVSTPFCAASDSLAASQYRWTPDAAAQADPAVSLAGAAGLPNGQCQLYPGARYAGHHHGGGRNVIGQYIMSPGRRWWRRADRLSQVPQGEFVHVHEMLHMAQITIKKSILMQSFNFDFIH